MSCEKTLNNISLDERKKLLETADPRNPGHSFDLIIYNHICRVPKDLVSRLNRFVSDSIAKLNHKLIVRKNFITGKYEVIRYFYFDMVEEPVFEDADFNEVLKCVGFEVRRFLTNDYNHSSERFWW